MASTCHVKLQAMLLLKRFSTHLICILLHEVPCGIKHSICLDHAVLRLVTLADCTPAILPACAVGLYLAFRIVIVSSHLHQLQDGHNSNQRLSLFGVLGERSQAEASSHHLNFIQIIKYMASDMHNDSKSPNMASTWHIMSCILIVHHMDRQGPVLCYCY